MKLILLICLSYLPLISFTDAGDPLLELDTLTTKSGKVYEEAKVMSRTPDKVEVYHKNGLANIKFTDLPDEVVKKLGGYDEKAAKKHAQKVREEQEKATKNNAEHIKKIRAKKAAEQARYSYLYQKIKAAKADIADFGSPKAVKRGKANNKKFQKLLKIMKNYSDATDIEINSWSECIDTHKIVIGMPEDLVLLSWGNPRDIDRNSHRDDVYTYRKGEYGGTLLYFRNGKLRKFSEY